MTEQTTAQALKWAKELAALEDHPDVVGVELGKAVEALKEGLTALDKAALSIGSEKDDGVEVTAV
jgi:hypothetical protein